MTYNTQLLRKLGLSFVFSGALAGSLLTCPHLALGQDAAQATPSVEQQSAPTASTATDKAEDNLQVLAAEIQAEQAQGLNESSQSSAENDELLQPTEEESAPQHMRSAQTHATNTPAAALPEDGWHTNEDGTLSYYKNGAFLTGLQILGDDTYYFGEDGHSRRWTQNIEGSTYYFDGSYKMHKGLLRWNATKDYSYFDELDGRAHTGLYKDYYFGADGRSKRWTQNIDGNTYYFDGSYKMHKGLLRWNATKDYSYFGNADGVMIKDSFTPSRTYYMGANGRSLQWTQNIDGNTYYFDGSYKMYKGLLRWNATKDYSYFGNDGAMVLNRFITPTAHKTYYFNNKGRSLRWLQTINQRKYYFNAAYLMHTGWLRWNADDTFSYFETNPSSTDYGAMYKGSRIVNGVSYDFGDKGKIDLSAPSRIISIAKKELGTTSGIKYWNYVYGGGYQDATSTPWCACFVSWVLNQSRAYLPGTPSGACTAIMNQSRAAGYEVSLKYVLPGDVLIFNWNGNDDFGDHIGIVESGKNGIFQTIEGNTLNGRVAQRTRYATQIIAVLRPRAKR